MLSCFCLYVVWLGLTLCCAGTTSYFMLFLFLLLFLLSTSTSYQLECTKTEPGHVAQSVGHLTRKSGVLGSIPGLATYFRFSFCFFKKGSCQLLAKVCHEVLVNRLGGLSLPRKSVVRSTDRPDMTLDVYHGRKTTMQQSNS